MLLLENDGAAYEGIVHQLLADLAIDLREVNVFGGAPKVRRVDGHEGIHEIGRVHGSQIITLHVFAQSLSAFLRERSGFGAVFDVAPCGRLWRGGMERPSGHGEKDSWGQERGNILSQIYERALTRPLSDTWRSRVTMSPPQITTRLFQVR